MPNKPIENVLIVVAHPDDETLWAGGTILSHPEWKYFVISVCRGGDEERSIRFFNALKILHAEGAMADMDDSPKQDPLDKSELESTILSLVPAQSFDLIITHNPHGEYTRHIRHEEVSKAVFELWFANQIQAPALWTFAYKDGGEVFYPKPMENANHHVMLTDEIWDQKYRLLTETYGFEEGSWEAKTCPKSEAFAQYKKWAHIEEDLKQTLHESPGSV